MKKTKNVNKKTTKCSIVFKKDDVRLLLTKTFQKKRCKKNGKEILMDIVLKEKKESTMLFIYQLLQVILT
jgi:hypothetical protein